MQVWCSPALLENIRLAWNRIAVINNYLRNFYNTSPIDLYHKHITIVNDNSRVVSKWRSKWNSTYFLFWLIIEGTTEKVLQFIMQFTSIYNTKLGFIEQKMYFWTPQSDSNKKKSINLHYFCHDNFFLMTFSELPSIGLCQY